MSQLLRNFYDNQHKQLIFCVAHNGIIDKNTIISAC